MSKFISIRSGYGFHRRPTPAPAALLLSGRRGPGPRLQVHKVCRLAPLWRRRLSKAAAPVTVPALRCRRLWICVRATGRRKARAGGAPAVKGPALL